MTGLIGLDWAMLAISLFNALLLLWLSLTVFLNAERRVWGIWLSSIGLLMGAIFFTSHSVILVQGINEITPGLNFWWWIGWISVVGLPFVWYVAVLWYSGYWDHPDNVVPGRSKLNQRQGRWFSLVIVFGLILINLLIFTNLLPSFSDLVNGQVAIRSASAAIFALIMFYVLCFGLSMDALSHPEKSRRLMGELARARARRWLMATSTLLLGVSLTAGGVMVWIVLGGVFQTQLMTTFGWFDLGITVLIGMSVFLLGQAVVSYEVFTGKTLPRRGLAQYWRRAVILAAGFSLLVSGTLVVGLRPIYTLLLSAFVMVSFFALLGWRSYAERERLIKSLRPFASSQKMIDTLIDKGTALVPPQQESELETPFEALCENVLESERAGFFPHGQMAVLAGNPSFYPPGSDFIPENLAGVAARLQDCESGGLSLEPGEVEGVIFAVPLWRDGGLSGMILLGQKQGGRPYTQEEIEIAQATGERLIDARATTELIRRLISLQRQHMVTGQVVDQRVRRKVHDEILPQVHTAILDLIDDGERQSENGKTLELLEGIHIQLANLLQSLPNASAPKVDQYGLVGALRQTIDDEMEGFFDEVDWQIETQAEVLARDLPQLVIEVVYAAVREGFRNAARHGRGQNDQPNLCLRIGMRIKDENQLYIFLEDNGVGFEDHFSRIESSQHLNFGGGNINLPEDQSENNWHHGKGKQKGNRSDLNGSGQGLALYSTLMAVIGGSLTVTSHPGQYTRMTLELPVVALGNYAIN
jgi:signal transduction histidine kinase